MNNRHLLNRIFIHHGSNNLDLEMNYDVRNVSRMYNKPTSAFFATDYLGEYNEYGRSSWIEFVTYNTNCDELLNRLDTYTLFELNNTANIRVVNTRTDYSMLRHNYTFTINIDGCEIVLLDYEKLSRDYDGLYITENLLFNGGDAVYDELSTFNVSTLVLFNLHHLNILYTSK